MIALIADNRTAIADLCRQYRVRKLDLFGSTATGAFDPTTSDIDSVVDLGGYEPGVARRFFDFIEKLEDLLGRDVDMITDDSIWNPYFREAVDEQRVTIHEAGNSEVAA